MTYRMNRLPNTVENSRSEAGDVRQKRPLRAQEDTPGNLTQEKDSARIHAWLRVSPEIKHTKYTMS